MKWRAAVVAGLVTIAVAAPPSNAFWDAAGASRFFDEEARRAYGRGDYHLALDYFLLAHDAAPAASSAYNVATVAELAGDRGLAFAFLTTYESLAAPDDPNRAGAREASTRLAARLALVDVVTDPPGADVFVDQREHGRYVTAPGVVALEPGAHTVMASLGGHRDATASVTVQRGRRTRVELRLEELRSELRVSGAPDGAVVTYDRGGEPLGSFPAAAPSDVPAGELHVVVTCEGYEPFERTVHVAREARRELVVAMAPLPPVLGRLLVSTGGIVARVAIDGEDRTETPATLRLPVGTHTVTVSADGYATATTTVEIQRDQSSLLEPHLIRARDSR